MSEIENISHIYKGLMARNRAFASFKEKGELDIILADITQYISVGECILDPMSGYGGGMRFWGRNGFKTTNIELNPPAYYWQVLNNPSNTAKIQASIKQLLSRIKELPQIKQSVSVSDKFFTPLSIDLISKIFELTYTINEDKELSIAIILPFVSRFAHYQRSSTNITHFKEGGLCSYVNWIFDFVKYLKSLNTLLEEESKQYLESKHTNILSDIMEVCLDDKFQYFVTSPPYPNYRDYSKFFRIENWVLDNIIEKKTYNFQRMIGSNIVSGKSYGKIESAVVNAFLSELLEKAKKLSKKAQNDIRVYYHPYFCQYFYNIQESLKKVDSLLSEKAIGYIVVNDNITRDILIPVGASICDIFTSMGYYTKEINTSHISHYGNIGKTAKRINSHHVRHIIKVWK